MLTRQLFFSLVICVLGVAAPVHMTAQQSRPSAPPTTTPTTPLATNLTANLATITTDTGAMAPGHQDFSSYTRPEFCLAALIQAQTAARRSLESQIYLDTLHDMRRDTLGLAELRLVGHACTAHRSTTPIAVNPHDLWNLALLTHDDTLARAAYQRIVASDTSPVAKATAQLSALAEVLGISGVLPVSMRGARPYGMSTVAQVVLADIDRAAPLPVRLQAHVNVLNYWIAWDSLAAVQQTATGLLPLLRQAPPEVKHSLVWQDASWQAYHALMAVAFLTSPDSMMTIAAMAKQDSLRFRDGSAAANLSASDIIDSLSPIGAGWNPQHREPSPRLTAAAWLPMGTDPVVPAPGKVTLLVSTAASNGNRFDEPIPRTIRRWLSRYGSQGLTVTIVEAMDDTVPYWYHGWNDWVLGPLTSAQVAREDGWFYREYAHLPVTIAVQERQDHFDAWPSDQRTIVAGTPFEQRYGEPDPDQGAVVLIDREGRVVMSGYLNQAWMERIIARIVKQ